MNSRAAWAGSISTSRLRVIRGSRFGSVDGHVFLANRALVESGERLQLGALEPQIDVAEQRPEPVGDLGAVLELAERLVERGGQRRGAPVRQPAAGAQAIQTCPDQGAQRQVRAGSRVGDAEFDVELRSG